MKAKDIARTVMGDAIADRVGDDWVELRDSEGNVVGACSKRVAKYLGGRRPSPSDSSIADFFLREKP